MNIGKAEKALEQIAKKEGVSIDTVRKEIQHAICTARQSSDPKIQTAWRAVPCKGKIPTPEELILYIAKRITPD